MKWKRSVLLVLTMGLLETIGETQSAKKPGLHEQSVFSAEDVTVQRPVTVPERVLQILRNDEDVLLSLNAENKSPDQLPTAWFLVSEVHLHGPDEVDLVVMGVGRLRGANIVPFWVFRNTPQGYELVLKTAGHDFKVLRATWRGYRNIEIAAPIAGMASTVVYRFDGKQYQPYQKKSEPIR